MHWQAQDLPAVHRVGRRASDGAMRRGLHAHPTGSLGRPPTGVTEIRSARSGQDAELEHLSKRGQVVTFAFRGEAHSSDRAPLRSRQGSRPARKALILHVKMGISEMLQREREGQVRVNHRPLALACCPHSWTE